MKSSGSRIECSLRRARLSPFRRLSSSKISKKPTRKTEIFASEFLFVFFVCALFLKKFFKLYFKRHFDDQNKLLNLVGRTVKYGLILAHLLTERHNKGIDLRG